ncbi:MAG: glutamate--cysteine ligase [Acinetobacter sp.]|nr:glutamate--cysteine ligase [Acinetobacter sp.]
MVQQRSVNPASPFPFATVQSHDLQGMKRGIERESLRMQSNGFLSQAPHPIGLGSALTHPKITTDYSEALMEFITSPKDTIAQALDELRDIHHVVYQHLAEGEKLWSMSMPCMLDEQEENIPLAYYGTSNIGRFKTLYRRGLGVRYGRRMQTIAGVHYNLSFPEQLFIKLQQQEQDEQLKQLSLQDYRSHRYFGLIRNFIRLVPLVMYVIGASPAVCRCFLTGRTHHLQDFVQGSLYLPNATALRMGNLGYQNTAQKQLGIHYNDLHGYLTGLQAAVHSKFAAFTALGLNDEQGEPIQINDHILQIENEYYSLIRPKQIPQAGETPSQALANRGVAYVELRAVDINPYSDIGVDEQTAGFLESLALYCLLSESPIISAQEQALIDQQQNDVVNRGREQDLMLHTLQGDVSFQSWATAHLQAIQHMATWLDDMTQSDVYQNAVQTMLQRVAQHEMTLSAKILQDIQQHGSTWKFGHALAVQHYQTFQAENVDKSAVYQHYQQLAAQSLQQQQQLEQETQVSFADYVQNYRS